MLKNPSFEDSFIVASENFDDWAINFNTTRTKVTDATDQIYAVKIQTNRSGSNGFFAELSAATPSNDLNFEDGKTYTISFDYKIETGTITELRATLQRNNFNLEDEQIRTNQTPNGWQTLTYDFTAAFTAAHNFDINLIGASANAEIIIDNTNVTEKVVSQDRDALIALYNATDGANWLNTWDLNSPIDTWSGVGLNANGRVDRLYLRQNRLSGSLPPEIGQLSELTALSFTNASNAAIPENNNQIIGNLPPEIGNLSNLETLELSNNPITGKIPVELGNLSNLKYVRFFNTNFTGELPSELGNLTSLENFNIKRNSLTGPIPLSIFSLPNLTSFSASNNKLSGEIPKEFGQLSSLAILDLNSNNFTGSIPKELGQLTNLIGLDLSRNNLEGTIPKELGQLQDVAVLNLLSNALVGAIPSELGQLLKLRDINLYDNQLSGEIPQEIAQLPSLERAFLARNFFSGEVPNFTSSNLAVLQLEVNQFVFDDIVTMSQNLNGNVNFLYSGQANIGIKDTIIVQQGESFTLSVNNTNDPNNLYQWRRNNEPIINATSPEYVINSFSNQFEGEYDCVITNTSLPGLTLFKNIIELYGDDDNDGVPNNRDNCQTTPPGAIVGAGGCSYLDVLVPKPDDFTAKVTSTTCPNTSNGKIEVTFKVQQTHYINITGPNGFSESYTKERGTPLIIPDLPSGDYTLIINSQIGTLSGAPNTEFKLKVETPEDFKSGKVVVKNKRGKVVVSGSTTYDLVINEKKITYSFEDTGNNELVFDLEEGANDLVIKTDKNCQGEHLETIILNIVRLFPNPTSDMVQILGLKNEENATVAILTMSGVLVKSESKDITDSSLEVSLLEIPEGMYLIQIRSKEQDVQAKIIKK